MPPLPQVRATARQKGLEEICGAEDEQHAEEATTALADTSSPFVTSAEDLQTSGSPVSQREVLTIRLRSRIVTLHWAKIRFVRDGRGP